MIDKHSSTALLTDKYELTMLQASLADGSGERQVAFEVFGRRLPNERRYGVVAGTARVLDATSASPRNSWLRWTSSTTGRWITCVTIPSAAKSTATAKESSTSPPRPF